MSENEQLPEFDENHPLPEEKAREPHVGKPEEEDAEEDS